MIYLPKSLLWHHNRLKIHITDVEDFAKYLVFKEVKNKPLEGGNVIKAMK